MIHIDQLANFFLLCPEEESGDVITHLKVQKLAYYAQAWYLAFHDGAPLVDEDFEAWAHGPVCPPIYDRFSAFGFSPIPRAVASAAAENSFGDALNHLSDVWQVYGKFTAKELERITHSEEPWIEARGNLGPLERSNTVISRQTMQTYYANRLADVQEK